MNKDIRMAIRNRIIPLVLFTLGMLSCTNNNDEMKYESYVAPGIYSTEITLSTEQGKSTDINTRGLDTGKGEFTSVYPYDYIYIHSADNKTDGTHRVLRIPLKEVIYCDECKGIQLEVEVMDDENGNYVIKSSDGESITLAGNESVYFSTIDKPFWTASILAATPISGKKVFSDSEVYNTELLKSKNTYTKSALIELIQEEIPVIEMSRICTGFRIYFMFTIVEEEDGKNNTVNETTWPYLLPGTKPSDFYIKLYLGPNFCEKFDVLNSSAVGTEGGYYSTNSQKYQQFKNVNYSFTGGGEGDSYTYQGYGYQTADYHYLLSPLNANINASEFSIYAFIKYIPDGTPDLTNDNDSKYFRTQIAGFKLELNRIHYIVMAFDLRDLKAFTEKDTSTTNVLTRSPWEEPEAIELKPVKVICR